MKKFFAAVLVTAILLAVNGVALAAALDVPAEGFSIRGEETLLTLFELIPLGKDAEGNVDVLSGGRQLAIPQASLDGLMSGEDLQALPDESQMATYQKGSKDPEVILLQEKLVTLALLKSADGDYGNMTATAVKSLQQLMGMEQSGVLDPSTQLALNLAIAGIVPDLGKTPIETDISLSIRLADWDERLAPMSLVPAGDDGSFTYSYDDMTDEGALWQPVCCKVEVLDGRQIDQRVIEVQLGILMQSADSGMTLTPVMRVNSKGTRRLFLEEVLVKAGERRITLVTQTAVSAVEGVQISETVDLPLDAEAFNVLANAVEAGELRLRIAGKVDSYDAELDEQARQFAARFEDVCERVGMIS